MFLAIEQLVNIPYMKNVSDSFLQVLKYFLISLDQRKRAVK